MILDIGPHFKAVQLKRDRPVWFVVQADGVSTEAFNRLLMRLEEAFSLCIWVLGTKFNFRGVVRQQITALGCPEGVNISVDLQLRNNGENTAVADGKTKADVARVLTRYSLQGGARTLGEFLVELMTETDA